MNNNTNKLNLKIEKYGKQELLDASYFSRKRGKAGAVRQRWGIAHWLGQSL